jgi:hypothetical protein
MVRMSQMVFSQNIITRANTSRRASADQVVDVADCLLYYLNPRRRIEGGQQ